LRTTLAGGVLFLLPVIIVLWFLGKAVRILERLAEPLVNATGIHNVAGVALSTIVSVAALVLIAFLAGLVARTRFGQWTLSTLENSIVGLVPQWRMARGLIESLSPEKMSHVDVVLVPTDAGWCVGFVLEKPAGDWWTVFIPGAPQWTSGGVSYAHVDQVHPTNLSFAEAILILRRCGTGSAKIPALLATLEQEKAAVAKTAGA
jgi:uncharacterized membrane protein